MKTKIFNKKYKIFVLATYLFLIVASTFHHHTYSFQNSDYSILSVQTSNEKVNDFLDATSGICALDHFFHSINSVDILGKEKITSLPETDQVKIQSYSPSLNNNFNLSYPLRAPPIV